MVDDAVNKVIDNLRVQNANSAETVQYYLSDFETFTSEIMRLTPKELIRKLKDGTLTDDPKEEQVYEVGRKYAIWLSKNRLETGDNNERTVSLKLYWARIVFESHFIPVIVSQWRRLVKPPKPAEPDISPIGKKQVVDIILSFADIRMQSYVMFLASTGWRASESMSLRLSNLENYNPDTNEVTPFDVKTLKFTGVPFVNASGKHAKTKKGKRRQLTAETARQIERLLAHTYRDKRVSREQADGKFKDFTWSDTAKAEDRIFAPYHSENHETHLKGKDVSLNNLYNGTSVKFRQQIDKLGIKFEDNSKRRKVTLHSMRRFVYTTCKRTVDDGYAQYHIGRKNHEYDKATPEQIAQDFASVEPYLTFLDTTAMEEKQKSITRELADTKKEMGELRKYVDAKNAEWEKQVHPDWSRADWDAYYDSYQTDAQT